MTRVALILVALILPGAASAKEKATFLSGQYATEADCAKLRKIEAGEPKNVETAPELLTADGFQGWEGGCEFTKTYEHNPGKSWVGLMVCSEGQTIAPATFVFLKSEEDDSFEVASQGQDEPELFIRCDAKEGK